MFLFFSINFLFCFHQLTKWMELYYHIIITFSVILHLKWIDVIMKSINNRRFFRLFLWIFIRVFFFSTKIADFSYLLDFSQYFDDIRISCMKCQNQWMRLNANTFVSMMRSIPNVQISYIMILHERNNMWKTTVTYESFLIFYGNL